MIPPDELFCRENQRSWLRNWRNQRSATAQTAPALGEKGLDNTLFRTGQHPLLVPHNHRPIQSMPSLLKNILFRISASRSSFVQLITSI